LILVDDGLARGSIEAGFAVGQWVHIYVQVQKIVIS
jgi:hypothetical protein